MDPSSHGSGIPFGATPSADGVYAVMGGVASDFAVVDLLNESHTHPYRSSGFVNMTGDFADASYVLW